ncbi:helix-turn-helix domain-containing protein [Dellaglioa sp. L3N]
MENQIISISIPPFPSFIEGNFTLFKPGQEHPHRKNIRFFDLIFVKKGTLYLQENNENYTINENEMFILLPDKEHSSWKPCEEKTEFFWIHIYTTARWSQSNYPVRFISELPIPELHFHQKSYTLQLPKLGKIREPDLIFELLEEIQKSTKNERIDSIWYTEELFLRFLKYVEDKGIYKDHATILAERIHLYLEENFQKHVDNAELAKSFHLHPNYISRTMSNIYGKTAMEILEEIRIDTAKQYMIHTNFQLKKISQLVGFKTYISFTSRFKKITGIAPKSYRDKHV